MRLGRTPRPTCHIWTTPLDNSGEKGSGEWCRHEDGNVARFTAPGPNHIQHPDTMLQDERPEPFRRFVLVR